MIDGQYSLDERAYELFHPEDISATLQTIEELNVSIRLGHFLVNPNTQTITSSSLLSRACEKTSVTTVWN